MYLKKYLEIVHGRATERTVRAARENSSPLAIATSDTDESKGYAFLTFEKKETARYVVRNCNQHPFNYLDGNTWNFARATWEQHTAKTHVGLKNIEARENSVTEGGEEETRTQA